MRKTYSAEFKAKLVIEVFKGNGFLMQLPQKTTFIPMCLFVGKPKLPIIYTCFLKMLKCINKLNNMKHRSKSCIHKSGNLPLSMSG